jgi:hypothetical protein
MTVPAIYNGYITDPAKEQAGIVKDFGDFVVTVARAGGSNEAYGRIMAELYLPYEQVMALDEMPEDKARELWYQGVARTVIKHWAFKSPDPENHKKTILRDGLGIDDQGQVVPATEANIIELFKAAHELFIEIRSFAERRENYSRANMQAAAKN